MPAVPRVLIETPSYRGHCPLFRGCPLFGGSSETVYCNTLMLANSHIEQNSDKNL